MVLPISKLYEITFHLIYLLRIQPSEINQLTVPESRSFIRLYENVKAKEKEMYEEHKASKNKPKTTTIRRSPRRRRG